MECCCCALVVVLLIVVYMLFTEKESHPRAAAAIPTSVVHPHATFERFFRPQDCDWMYSGRGQNSIRYDLSKSGHGCEDEPAHRLYTPRRTCRDC